MTKRKGDSFAENGKVDDQDAGPETATEMAMRVTVMVTASASVSVSVSASASAMVDHGRHHQAAGCGRNSGE